MFFFPTSIGWKITSLHTLKFLNNVLIMICLVKSTVFRLFFSNFKLWQLTIFNSDDTEKSHTSLSSPKDDNLKQFETEKISVMKGFGLVLVNVMLTQLRGMETPRKMQTAIFFLIERALNKAFKWYLHNLLQNSFGRWNSTKHISSSPLNFQNSWALQITTTISLWGWKGARAFWRVMRTRLHKGNSSRC